MKRIRAIGLVIHQNKIALVHRNVGTGDYFIFPGGGVEAGETNEVAAVREVQEEIGLTVEVKRLLYTIVDETSEHYFYLCTYLSGDLKKEDGLDPMKTQIDSKMPAWYDIDAIAQMKVFPLEVRDWIIEDARTDFIQPLRTLSLLVSERRKI